MCKSIYVFSLLLEIIADITVTVWIPFSAVCSVAVHCYSVFIPMYVLFPPENWVLTVSNHGLEAKSK